MYNYFSDFALHVYEFLYKSRLMIAIIIIILKIMKKEWLILII